MLNQVTATHLMALLFSSFFRRDVTDTRGHKFLRKKMGVIQVVMNQMHVKR